MRRRFRMINENLTPADYSWSNRRIGDTSGTYAPKYETGDDIIGLVQFDDLDYIAVIRDKFNGDILDDEVFPTASQAERWVERWFKRNLFDGNTSKRSFRVPPKIEPLDMEEYGELPSGNPGIIAENRYCSLTLSGNPIICELLDKSDLRRYYISYHANQERSAMRDFREYTRALSTSLNVAEFIDVYGFKPLRRRLNESSVRSAYHRYSKSECKSVLSKIKGIGRSDIENIATVLSNADPDQEPVFDTSDMTGRRMPQLIRDVEDIADIIDYLEGEGFEFEANASGKRSDDSVILYFRNMRTNRLVTAEIYNSTAYSKR